MNNAIKQYELTILMHEDVTDEMVQEMTEMVKGYDKNATIEDDGLKRLAYPIRDEDRARYLFYTLMLKDGEPQELSSRLNPDENVLRFLLVRTGR